MVRRLTPHIRQFIRVRQALVRAEAHGTSVTALLDNSRIGVLHLDRRGKIIEVNDRARSILRHGDGLSDRDGVLGALNPYDQRRLEGLVAGALPTAAVTVSGRCCWPARPACRRSWSMSTRRGFTNRTTERGISPRWP